MYGGIANSISNKHRIELGANARIHMLSAEKSEAIERAHDDNPLLSITYDVLQLKKTAVLRN